MTLAQAMSSGTSSGRPCVFVQNGQSIQAAINAAKPGTVIFIEPGTYSEALQVHTADIELVGLMGPDGSHAVLVNPGQGGVGVHVDAPGTGFSMRYLEIRGFSGDGVDLYDVNSFHLTHLLLVDNGSGIATAYSSNGTIQYTEESGQSMAGLAVRGSRNVLVQYNRSYANTVGVEVVNSTSVQVEQNDVFDNTAGIVAALLPGATGSNVLIAENYVSANNLADFAAPGSAEADLVQGTGILILGTNQTTVQDNLVMGNETLGIGVLNMSKLFRAYGATSPGLVVAANDTDVTGNGALDNGFYSMTPKLPQGADLIWDGHGVGNQWSNNLFGTSLPAALPG